MTAHFPVHANVLIVFLSFNFVFIIPVLSRPAAVLILCPCVPVVWFHYLDFITICRKQITFVGHKPVRWVWFLTLDDLLSFLHNIIKCIHHQIIKFFYCILLSYISYIFSFYLLLFILFINNFSHKIRAPVTGTDALILSYLSEFLKLFCKLLVVLIKLSTDHFFQL